MDTRVNPRTIAAGLAGLAVCALIAFLVIRPRSDDQPADSSDNSETAASDDMPSALETRVTSTTGYAGSDSCRECHADTCHSYQSHPMSHSLRPIADVEAVDGESGARFTSLPNVAYFIEKADAGTFHHEVLSDRDGEEVYDQDFEVSFAIGSGRRGRSYVINQDGYLFLSPITWYSNGNKWDLAPGYDPALHPRFERQASDGCFACHAGVMNVNETSFNRFDSDEPFLEHSISCERCHGPAADHVYFHHNFIADGAGNDPIVDLASLTPTRRNAVCYQCHLNAENRVLQPGRSDFSFRPGMPFSENWMIFLEDHDESSEEAANSIDSVGQVEQMWKSRCFIESNGRMECITCHDPHAKPGTSDRIEWFRSRCLSCHGSEDDACRIPLTERREQETDGSCVACHMPTRDVNNVPHTALTDHRILRHAEIASEAKMADGDVRMFPKMWIEEEVEIPPSLVRRANGILMARYAFDYKDKELAAGALRMLRDSKVEPSRDYEAAVAIGQAYSVGGNVAAALEIWNEGLETAPENERLLELIGTTFHEQGQFAQAYETYARLLEVNPFRPRYFGRMVHVCGERGDMRKAVAAADRALQLNPGLVQVHEWLSIAHKAAGNSRLALKHERMVDLLLPSEESPEAEDSPSAPDSSPDTGTDGVPADSGGADAASATATPSD